LLVYSSIGRKRFEETPRDLVQAADDARRKIDPPNQDSNNLPPDSGIEVIDYRAKVEEVGQRIDERLFATHTLWNRPLFAERRKRGEPGLFPVQDLHCTAGMGRFAVQGRATGIAGLGGPTVGTENDPGTVEKEEPLGRRWVVVTGVVDDEKYWKAFRECFKDVIKKYPDTDVPDFVYYRVERAEAGDVGKSGELKWTRFNLRREMAKTRDWNVGVSSEIIDPRYIDEDIVFPLGPLVDRDWGVEIAHPPEIPMPSEEDRYRLPGEQEHPDDLDGPDVPDFDDPTGPGRRSPMGMGRPGLEGGLIEPGAGRRTPTRRPAMRRPSMRGLNPEYGDTMGLGGAGRRRTASRRPGPAGGEPGMIGPGGRGSGLSGTEEPPPHLLFRFFDYSVEPGKRYRYRVRLLLRNPNHGVDARYLEPGLQQLIKADENLPKAKKQWKKYIESDWSEPTEIVTVPRDDRVLAVSVKPTLRPTVAGPTATLLAIHWDMHDGVEIFDEFEVQRGSLADFLDQKIPDSEDASRLPGPGMGISLGPEMGFGQEYGEPGALRQPKKSRRRKKKEELDEGEKVDYKTGVLVLDIQGGQRLPGRNRDLTEPGEMLLLEPDGSLIVRSDVGDLAQYDERVNPAEPRDASGRLLGRPMGRGGGIEGEMGMPMEPGIERPGTRRRPMGVSPMAR
jgi:hypothetical protein